MPFGARTESEQTAARWLARPDLEPHAPDFSRLAESDIAREVDCTFEDASQSGPLDGSGVLTLPADCLYVRKIWSEGAPAEPWVLISPEEAANLEMSFSGFATRYAYRRGTTLVYVPVSSETYAMEYRRAPTGLGSVGGGESPAYLLNLFDCLLYGSLVHAAPFLKADSRLPTWTALYERCLIGTRRMEWKKRTGGPTLVARPSTWASESGAL